MKRSPRMYSRLRYSWIPISAANTEVSVTCRREGQKNAPENVEEKNYRQFSSDSRSTNVRPTQHRWERRGGMPRKGFVTTTKHLMVHACKDSHTANGQTHYWFEAW